MLVRECVFVSLGTVQITVVKCNALPKMDAFGKVDGYVKLRCGTVSTATQTIKSEYNPVFNHKVWWIACETALSTCASRVCKCVWFWFDDVVCSFLRCNWRILWRRSFWKCSTG